jgi:two-component system cell cycle sensor histidine kinase/response regulator CckA
LLAEDEEAVRQLASFVLREEGYNVLESTDGQEALELAGSFDGDIDLLVADAIMPRMGGRQLADCMASQRPATRVLFTSGYTNDDIVTQSDGNKFAAFLQKPFTPASLARKVREVLDRN